jgi:hypothetical protein
MSVLHLILWSAPQTLPSGSEFVRKPIRFSQMAVIVTGRRMVKMVRQETEGGGGVVVVGGAAAAVA